MTVKDFIKIKRVEVKLTQPELAAKAGVGLRFIREIEQGKKLFAWIKSTRYCSSLGLNLDLLK